MKLLFVCLGNICRSPSAEAIAVKIIQQQGLDWSVDSAGTSGHHDGEMADPRSIRHATKRGYTITSISRRVIDQDFKNFDWVIAMDESNLANLKRMCPDPRHLPKIVLMTDYCTNEKCVGVPDPYYGGADGFDRVIDILEDAISGMIKRILHESSISRN